MFIWIASNLVSYLKLYKRYRKPVQIIWIRCSAIFRKRADQASLSFVERSGQEIKGATELELKLVEDGASLATEYVWRFSPDLHLPTEL